MIKKINISLSIWWLIIIIASIIMITMIYTSFIFSYFPNAFEAGRECNFNKRAAYEFCSNFNFLAFLNMEYVRHYQNSTFEYGVLPNCFWIYNKTENINLTVNDWMSRYNITHMNWTNLTNEKEVMK